MFNISFSDPKVGLKSTTSGSAYARDPTHKFPQ